MKSLTKFPLAIAAVFAASFLVASADDKSAKVTVSFQESDKFTDVRAHFGGSTDEGYLKVLSSHLEKEAGRRLAAGQKLEVTITDVDLAGDYVPSASTSQDIRVIREIYIPRVKLSFKLLDAAGNVVKEGQRNLSDMDFMNNIGLVGRNDPLFYDKNLLNDWVRKEFKS